MSLRIRLFAHSFVSDWNHGNAHFLRGLARSLMQLGHNVRCFEELGSWSLSNLVRSEGEAAIEAIDDFRRSYPELDIHFYRNDETFAPFIEEQLEGVDLVVLHEWNDPAIVNRILARKDQFGYRVLFHDTHHRAYTRAGEMLKFHLHKFDGVLAFGEAIRKIYHDGFGVPRVWTFHEAADPEIFKPMLAKRTADLLWIGNWGDEERTRELHEYFIGPVESLKGIKAVAHGVRYPDSALHRLQEAGIEYRGYLPNLKAPLAYSQSALSIHVPRRQYANGLSGIPTIRVFEALACGATLVCSPWSDEEHLFRPGQDYLLANDGREMRDMIASLLRDEKARKQIAASGIQTIRNHHTCLHRAEQLMEIWQELERA